MNHNYMQGLDGLPHVLWASGCWHFERTLYSRRPLKRDWSFYLSRDWMDEKNTCMQQFSVIDIISVGWLYRIERERDILYTRTSHSSNIKPLKQYVVRRLLLLDDLTLELTLTTLNQLPQCHWRCIDNKPIRGQVSMSDGCQKVQLSTIIPSLSVFPPTFSGIFVQKFRGYIHAGQALDEISHTPMFAKGSAIFGSLEMFCLGLEFLLTLGYFMSPNKFAWTLLHKVTGAHKDSPQNFERYLVKVSPT